MSQILNKIKIILDDDEVKDELLSIYIDNATDFIIDYTNLKAIPKTLESVIIEMTIYQFRNRELENVKSESIGAMSYSFTESYPDSITSRLNGHKRVTVV